MLRLHRERYDKTTQKSYFYFLCDCGNTVVKRSDSKSEFCCKPGCIFSRVQQHGKGSKANKLYRRWEGIRNRCYGTHKSAKTYKDRGIIMCDEWKYDFLAFEKWALANGYSPELDIDRIDIDRNYEPGNCEFVTRSENTRRQNRDGHGRKRISK